MVKLFMIKVGGTFLDQDDFLSRWHFFEDQDQTFLYQPKLFISTHFLIEIFHFTHHTFYFFVYFLIKTPEIKKNLKSRDQDF